MVSIGLKEYKRGELKRNKLVFEIVKSFMYVKHMSNYNYKRENFMVKYSELLKVEWSIKPGTRTTRPIYLTRINTKVVAKKNDTNM